jgi:hypothetical protein
MNSEQQKPLSEEGRGNWDDIFRKGKPKMDDKIFECPCGRHTFQLHKNGDVQCVSCKCKITDIKVTFPEGIPSDAD